MEDLKLVRLIKILSIKLDKEINNVVSQYELTSSQSMILFFVFAHKDKNIYPRDLEKKFNLSHPTVLGILKRLQEKGFIEIHKSNEDSRYRLIKLTNKGLETESKASKAIDSLEKKLQKSLGIEESILFKNFLHALIKELKGEEQCLKQF
ncbi:MAG: MarR family transcriptional regulator [Erysipelotrichaceae bacterium]|nr:MarR family transcriptional regulator [Erysipelotrichaceae bacterium]